MQAFNFLQQQQGKIYYTLISLYNKTCLGEKPRSQETASPVWPTKFLPLKLYECFFSPVLFTSHFPLFNLLYISPLCYLLHIFPSAIHFISALPAIYIKSPLAIYFTFHRMLFATATLFPYTVYFPLLIYLMCVLSLLFSWHFSSSVIHFKSSAIIQLKYTIEGVSKIPVPQEQAYFPRRSRGK